MAVGGTMVSLAAPSGGTGAVVVGTSTEGLGPYIVGGLGGGTNNGTGVVGFTGGAGGMKGGLGLGKWWVVGGVVGWGVWWVGRVG